MADKVQNNGGGKGVGQGIKVDSRDLKQQKRERLGNKDFYSAVDPSQTKFNQLTVPPGQIKGSLAKKPDGNFDRLFPPAGIDTKTWDAAIVNINPIVLRYLMIGDWLDMVVKEAVGTDLIGKVGKIMAIAGKVIEVVKKRYSDPKEVSLASEVAVKVVATDKRFSGVVDKYAKEVDKWIRSGKFSEIVNLFETEGDALYAMHELYEKNPEYEFAVSGLADGSFAVWKGTKGSLDIIGWVIQHIHPFSSPVPSYSDFDDLLPGQSCSAFSKLKGGTEMAGIYKSLNETTASVSILKFGGDAQHGYLIFLRGIGKKGSDRGYIRVFIPSEKIEEFIRGGAKEGEIKVDIYSSKALIRDEKGKVILKVVQSDSGGLTIEGELLGDYVLPKPKSTRFSIPMTNRGSTDAVGLDQSAVKKLLGGKANSDKNINISHDVFAGNFNIKTELRDVREISDAIGKIEKVRARTKGFEKR